MPRNRQLTHINPKGELNMVDITEKNCSSREATATARILLTAYTLRMIKSGASAKGDVFACARMAGILASKKVGELIPLAHNINLTHTQINFKFSSQPRGIIITATSKTNYATGVEMEALIAATIAALTIYDMVKAVEKKAQITEIKLLKKSGGKTKDREREIERSKK